MTSRSSNPIATWCRRRLLAALAVLLALAVVAVAVQAQDTRSGSQNNATSCGYYLTTIPYPHWIYVCYNAGGGGGGSW